MRDPGIRRGTLLAAWLLVLPLLAAAAEWKSFRPEKGPTRYCVSVSGKERRYYELDPRLPVTFTLTGPNRVRLITRHVPPSGDSTLREYTIRVLRDGRQVLRKRIIANVRSTVTLCGDSQHPIGWGRRSYLSVPKDSHLFEIYVLEKDPRVLVRLHRRVESKSTAPLEPLVPQDHAGICTLLTADGREYPHFRFSRREPLEFCIEGPTTLSVYARAEIDHRMMGVTSFGIEVLRTGVLQRTFHFSGVGKLASALYREPYCSAIVPSQRRQLTLLVPEGQWSYRLRPTEMGNPSLAARVLIPKEDLRQPPCANP